MKEAKPFVIVRPQGYVYAQRVECEEPCEGETFTHGSVRG